MDDTFAQVAGAQTVLDWGANCGNLAAALGPFAVDEGLVRVADGGAALVRIHQVTTGKIGHARFPVQGGRAVVEGGIALDGVAGTGARIGRKFLSPAGTVVEFGHGGGDPRGVEAQPGREPRDAGPLLEAGLMRPRTARGARRASGPGQRRPAGAGGCDEG